MYESESPIESYEENFPEASSWNTTTAKDGIGDQLKSITMDSNFAWLLCSLLSAMIWVIYITYYHSRVLGFVLTRILNRNLFLKQGYMHIGKYQYKLFLF